MPVLRSKRMNRIRETEERKSITCMAGKEIREITFHIHGYMLSAISVRPNSFLLNNNNNLLTSFAKHP